MTETKHTPGPWKNNGGRIETEKDAYDGGIIATVGIVNHQDQTDTANAELIAAAPETACQRDELLEAMRQIKNNCVFLSDAVRIARAVLAKATDKQTESEKP